MTTDRLSTGIDGLDKIIQGGFPRGTINLIAGPAGSGKTLLALHFFHNGMLNDNGKSMFLSLEESRDSLDRVLKCFGMDIAAAEVTGKLALLDMGELRLGVKDSEAMMGFGDLKDFLSTTLPSKDVDRLVIDSLSAAGLKYRSLRELREALFSLVRFIRDYKVTALIVTECVEGEGLTRWGFEQFVSDSFIHLGLEETKGELRRTITIRKMRFTKHDTVKHPFMITSKGIIVEADERVV